MSLLCLLGQQQQGTIFPRTLIPVPVVVIDSSKYLPDVHSLVFTTDRRTDKMLSPRHRRDSSNRIFSFGSRGLERRPKYSYLKKIAVTELSESVILEADLVCDR
jgi:hypothetical protein